MLTKVISGGQTGADRGALDAALAAGFTCGGWCPRGRRAEDGPIPDRYPLHEMPSPRYLDRTRRNVAEADATLILARGTPTGGTRKTAIFADRLGKPCLILDPGRETADALLARATAWLAEHAVGTLNVAGPRASSDPEIQADAAALVAAIIRSA